MSRTKNVETRYCHDITCGMFNVEQDYRYSPTSWESPSEWIDDPECRECFGDVEEHKRDEKELVTDLEEALGLTLSDLDPNLLLGALRTAILTVRDHVIAKGPA